VNRIAVAMVVLALAALVVGCFGSSSKSPADCVAQMRAKLPDLRIVAAASKGRSAYWLGQSYGDVRALFAVVYPTGTRVYYERPNEQCNNSLYANSGGGDELVAPLPHGEIIVTTGPAAAGLLRTRSGRALLKAQGGAVRVSGEAATAVVHQGLFVIVGDVEVGVAMRWGNIAPPHPRSVIAALSQD
jgi:hypothetical protein